MKQLLIYLLPAILCSSSFPVNDQNSMNADDEISIVSSPRKDPITLQQASEILGEPARMTERNITNVDGVTKFNYSFTTIAGSEVPRVLYFSLDRYPNASLSTSAYSTMKVSNQTHAGFNILNGVADEAFVQTDKKNFYLMIARKNTSVMKMKLTRIGDKASFEVFQNTGKKISERI